jgi:hypothetical protein
MTKVSRDLSSGNLHPRENLFSNGILGMVGAEVLLPGDGAATVSLDLRGTFSATVEVSGSVDGANWTIIPMRPVGISANAYIAGITGSVTGIWVGKCAPFRLLRARCTAFTSGSVVATLSGDIAPLDDSLTGMITNQISTTVGASGAAVTLTLASPGAGLRQYLTYLSINRFAAAVLTASATPVTVTTTNLPGPLAFTFEADAATLGTKIPWREDFAYPVSAASQNTAVTIVCPVTTGVIWRVTAGYYIAN